MNKNLLKSAAVYAGLGLFVLVSFQNCAKVTFTDANGNAVQAPGEDANGVTDPTTGAHLSLVPDAPIGAEGQSVHVTVTYDGLQNISYSCKDRLSGEVVVSGQVSNSGQQVPVNIDRDVHCEATGTVISNQNPLTAKGDIDVDCGIRYKNPTTNRCEDFSCKQVITLDKSQMNNIPKRTYEGICYAVPMFGHIDNSRSTLTPDQDMQVVSRNHNTTSNNPADIRNPYVLGSSQQNFSLEGRRSVKLAGGASATAPILVDNFVLVGVYPASQDVSGNVQAYYKAMGTSDSTIGDANGNDTHSIKFGSTLIPLQAFGTGGTSTVAPLDISNTVSPGVTYRMDLRALDCGGARELSDIYLLFQ